MKVRTISKITALSIIMILLISCSVTFTPDEEISTPSPRPSPTELDVQTQTFTVEQEYTVQLRPNHHLAWGETYVYKPGAPGVEEFTYTITFTDGYEVSRRRISHEYISEPDYAIIEFGTGINLPQPDIRQPFVTVEEGGVENTGQGWGDRFETRHRQGSGIICEEGGFLTLSCGKVVEYIMAFDMMVTAYSSQQPGLTNRTATGTTTRLGVTSVDRRVIPMGSNLLIVGANGRWSYGFGRAEDVGGAVRGYIIDVYFPTVEQVNAFGRRSATVYVLR